MIQQPFRGPLGERFTFHPPAFTVDELIRMGVDQTDACMIVWPISEEAFEEYARERS